jgi:type IV secretory pathway TraG/TraD family ATPase VirD4
VAQPLRVGRAIWRAERPWKRARQIIIAVTVVLAAVWAATQWTAWQLGFAPQLGQA